MPLVRAFIGVKVLHPERIPATGAFILTPNHYTDVDPFVTGIALWKTHRVPRFLAKDSMFRAPLLGGFMRATGQIPVARDTGGADALAAAAQVNAEQAAVLIYPEGTLTRDPDLWPMRGKWGAARLALQTGVPVIPAAHWGAQKILPRWSKKLRLIPRTTVPVLIGEPVDLSPWEGKPLNAETLAAATLAIMQAITALVEQLRGETAPAERWDPAEHGQSEFGRPS
ncbi:MAG TPA: lysophospholipid acyltransferase family protein [Pseudolysinimonas sp.]|nr:lysophospholipid acyltransferase family protein [Pseudolysinimonas sp.]